MNQVHNYSSVSFLGLLQLLFLGLKLGKVINWSWVWVLSPMLIPICLVIVICIIFFFVGLVKTIIKRK